MFKIGDKIVYPMHGAGIITEVQNKEVLGVKKDYYILQMPMGEMKISIPVDKINDMGIRFVAQEETIHSLGAILGIIFTNVIFSNFIEKSTSVIIKIVAMIIAAVVFGFIFYALAPKFISVELKLIESIEDSLKKFSLVDIVIGTIGLVVGLILAFLISQPLLKLNIPGIGTVLTVIFEIVFYIGMGFLGAKLALNYHDDFLAFFDRIKTKEKPNLKFSSKDSKVRPKIVDTSTIIDGRIIDILKTGFLEGNLIIPIFVIEELQHIADSDNYLRRQKGRRGLDILKTMQTEYKDKVKVVDKRYPNIDKVDSMLVKMSEELNANLLTNDYNLNKVADLQEVFVFNINDLANAMRPVFVAGEPINVSIIKEGRENNQGIGYLDDGTMIVVEDGKKYLGQVIECTVTSVLQTSAGKMIFAKKSDGKDQ